MGDEAILISLVEQLRKLDPIADITVLSQRPEETSRLLCVNAVNRRAFLKVIKEIKATDVLINGGGSLFQDATSSRSLLYYVAQMRLARLYGKKTASISCGVGPVNRWFNRRLVRREIERSAFTTLREPESFEFLKSIGLDCDNMKKHGSEIAVTADLAVGLGRQDPSRGKEILGEFFKLDRPIVAMALRAKDFRPSLENSAYSISELKKAANALIKKGYDILFMPFFRGEDNALSDYLCEFEQSKNAIFLNDRYSVIDYISILGSCKMLVGTRLHSLIFATMAATPFIGISYDPKVDAFLHLIKKEPLFDSKSFSAERLLDSIDAVYLNYESEKQKVIELREEQENLLKENNYFINKLLGLS